MRAMPPMEQIAIEELLPQLPLVVSTSKKNGVTEVILMLDAFAGEPETLYNFIWYLYTHGLNAHVITNIQGDNAAT